MSEAKIVPGSGPGPILEMITLGSQIPIDIGYKIVITEVEE